MSRFRCAGLFLLLASLPASAIAADVVAVEPISVEAAPEGNDSTQSTLGATALEESNIETRRNNSDDAARLLLDVPGVGIHGNGGISSLPVIHGLADDRLRIQVDGVELTTACPNHMNSPLSYVDPKTVGGVTVFTGATPVSVGGDSIGGTVQVSSTPPRFATDKETYWVGGRLGSFYRSNGNTFGYGFSGSVAGRWLNVTYNESKSQSDNYVAGGSFKPVSVGREGGALLPGNEVGSSAYKGATNRSIVIAAQHAGQDVSVELARQTVDFEGFPNQRMDMTANDNRVAAIRYRGAYAWGDLLARANYQTTEHEMNMGPDRYSYGTGMPMQTRAKTRGAMIQGNVLLSETDVLRLGSEYQYYTLFDWWDPVTNSGSMGPNPFWNIDYGQRRKIDAFAEWEATWSRHWATQVGARSEIVTSNASAVQGYNNSFGDIWAEDAASFNATSREHVDSNWDVTALLRYAPQTPLDFVLGYSRKSRSPNLYQRYPWATNPMAALMNNLAGDGNGYVGNANLKPEVAHTTSLVANWHDAARKRWEVHATSFLTYIQDYIDASRCNAPQCAATVNQSTGFVLLRYTNQMARIHGMDLNGKLLLARSAKLGALTAKGALSYVDGQNISSGDGLYDIMPPNARVALEHSIGGASAATEILAVADKSHVSRVRNEIPTQAYWLLNLRFGYQWEHARLDLSLENVLNRFYSAPLGGAYVGQGPSMTTNGIRWGVAVPGRGRSFNLAFNYYF